MNPKFPLYIVSKGRADSRLTARALEAMNVPYYIIVEPNEVETYANVIRRENILPFDMSYKEKYDTFDDLGLSKSTGPGPARNFAWDHAIKNGHAWHWVMDDNIRHFSRLNNNMRIKVHDGTIFRCMEDFVLRYKNIGMAGPNYDFFVPRKQRRPPFITNTRIYSCNLIRNDVPFRWRGRYNEDTDLSLRMIKKGWCTVQFNAFLQGKVQTQVLKGGNTDEFYAQEGTLAKSQMQIDMHPDVSKLVKKYNRWHHHVNYKPFQKIPLIRKDNLEIKGSVNDYGMKITKVERKENG